MKFSLPILAIVGLIVVTSAHGQGPEATPAPGLPAAATKLSTLPGQTLMQRAADILDRHTAIAAKMRLTGSILDEPFQGFGVYLQGPAQSHLMRFEVKMAIGQANVTMQQVADGQYLWTRRAIDDSRTLRRVDLAQLQGRAGQGGMPIVGAVAPQQVLGFGGLPKLIRHLEGSFSFTSVQQTQLAGVPGFTLRGVWSRTALGQLLPEQKADIDAGAEPNLKRLPSQAPDQVVVFLGRDDLFPYRIEYRRADDSLLSLISGQTPAPKTLLALDLFEVRLNGTIDSAQFIYTPGSEPFANDTAGFVSRRQWAMPAAE